MRHDVSEGFLQKVGRNYFMWLSVDGQKKRRKTGTDDIEHATEMLAEWRAEERIGAVFLSKIHHDQTSLRSSTSIRSLANALGYCT